VLAFGAKSTKFRVWGLGFRVKSSGLLGLGFRVESLG
jgi:hypothetical protein